MLYIFNLLSSGKLLDDLKAQMVIEHHVLLELERNFSFFEADNGLAVVDYIDRVDSVNDRFFEVSSQLLGIHDRWDVGNEKARQATSVAILLIFLMKSFVVTKFNERSLIFP